MPQAGEQNLSEDKTNAFFARGIQDEIVTWLAKISALKVISRSSTKLYESKTANPTTRAVAILFHEKHQIRCVITAA